MTTEDGTHECPARGCTQRVPFDRLACSRHWYAVPKPLRDRLWREYRDHFGEQSYLDARDACVEALS